MGSKKERVGTIPTPSQSVFYEDIYKKAEETFYKPVHLMGRIMQNEELSSKKESEFDEISLDQEHESLKYTVVPNSLIRDNSISPTCIWLIIYLLSNAPGWTIKIKQLLKYMNAHMGRDRSRNAINEAIESGYMQRNVISKKVNGKVLRGYSYIISSTPKFKKSLLRTEFQETENVQNEKRSHRQEDLKSERFQCTDPQDPDSQDSKELLSSEELLSLKSHCDTVSVPKKTVPSKNSGKEEEENLLKSTNLPFREDTLGYLSFKYSENEIKEAISKFKNLQKKMKMKNPVGLFRSLLEGMVTGVAGNKSESNLQFFKRLVKENNIHNLVCKGKYISNLENGNEISLEIDQGIFCQEIMKWLCDNSTEPSLHNAR